MTINREIEKDSDAAMIKTVMEVSAALSAANVYPFSVSVTMKDGSCEKTIAVQFRGN